jgi:hypothetical protein
MTEDNQTPDQTTPVPEEVPGGAYKMVGWLILLIGAGLILAGFLMEGTVSNYSTYSSRIGSTYNIGLLNIKDMLVVAGGATQITGAIMIAIGELQSALVSAIHRRG